MSKVSRKENKTTTRKRTQVEGGVERMSVLCCNMWVCITECALHTASLIQKVFPYKTHFLRYILKYYKKHLRFFFSFFHVFFFFPEYGDQCCCSGFHYNSYVKMNNHYFNRSYSKALQLQKTWYDIQHLLHLYNVIQQCIESSDLNL